MLSIFGLQSSKQKFCQIFICWYGKIFSLIIISSTSFSPSFGIINRPFKSSRYPWFHSYLCNPRSIIAGKMKAETKRFNIVLPKLQVESESNGRCVIKVNNEYLFVNNWVSPNYYLLLWLYDDNVGPKFGYSATWYHSSSWLTEFAFLLIWDTG